MEYTEHYDNMTERNNLCNLAVNKGFRMLHDDFDADWERGDEPYGTLTFTNIISEPIPLPKPVVFEPAPDGSLPNERLNYIEAYLKGKYKG